MQATPAARNPHIQPISASRREFLKRAGAGFGTLGLAGILGEDGVFASGYQDPLMVRPSHFAPKAKSVISLFMYGGPSAVDLFDPKPELQKHHGKTHDADFDVFFGNPGPLMKSPYEFKQYGESGAWVSESS